MAIGFRRHRGPTRYSSGSLGRTARRRCVRAIVLVGAVVVWSAVGERVAAFQLQPMSASIDPVADVPAAMFEVSNTGIETIAVQLRATTRSIDPDGTEFNRDASSQLQIFPSQLILRPDQRQTVRVRWVGDNRPTHELPFRLVAEQLPINLDRTSTEQSGVRMLLRYRATVYVAPVGTRSDVQVEDLSVDRAAGEVTLALVNRGTAHQLVGDGSMLLYAGAERTSIPTRDIEVLASINLLPDGRRVVRVPLSALPFEPDRVDFRFDGS